MEAASREFFIKDSNMDKGSLSGAMEVPIKETLISDTSKEKACSSGVMGRAIGASGTTIPYDNTNIASWAGNLQVSGRSTVLWLLCGWSEGGIWSVSLGSRPKVLGTMEGRQAARPRDLHQL